MLRLLLDIHIPPGVAAGVRARRPNCTVESLRDWKDGVYRALGDALILTTAYDEGMTFVTYDVESITLLLGRWGASGRAHAGIIFIHQRTIQSHDVGRLVRSLTVLWDSRGREDWTNVVHHLERPPG